MAQVGVAPVLADPEIAAYLAGENTELNVAGIYSGTPAKPAEYSPFGPDILQYASNFFGDENERLH